MNIVARYGTESVATVYIAETACGERIEFVESIQPPLTREEKWVLIVSTLYGCPVRCRFCDAGGHYRGAMPAAEILSQIDYMVERRYPDRAVPAGKFKVQFARMGEPAFNDAVIDVLRELPGRFDAPGLMPALSTIAPAGSGRFFRDLLEIKRERYGGRFQLQFSIHTTDARLRDWLVPARKWSFAEIAAYGAEFHRRGDRKITLNFALAAGMPVDGRILLEHFTPDRYLVKITPVNPTLSSREFGVSSLDMPAGDAAGIIDELETAGYEVLLSIGELEENHIGSNCGQYVTAFLRGGASAEEGYSYVRGAR
jgi:23S rRNA (adenine2503-C2)-methyltransferase